MYSLGEGVDKNLPESFKWWRKAAEADSAEAQHRLGSLYYSGRGVEKDDAEALKWFRRAAEHNIVGAQILTGTMYEQGRGAETDFVQAYAYYDLAAKRERKNPAAVHRGLMAEEKRDTLARKMTPSRSRFGPTSTLFQPAHRRSPLLNKPLSFLFSADGLLATKRQPPGHQPRASTPCTCRSADLQSA